MLWPLHIVAVLFAAVTIYLIFRPSRRFAQIPVIYTAIAWLGIGIGYFAVHFSTLNWAAWLSAALFTVQGLLLAWFGLVRDRLHLQFSPTPSKWTGLAFLLFSIGAYPLFGLASGLDLTELPIVGIDPGPTVLFTWGLLILETDRVPLVLTIAPLTAAITGAAAGWLIDLPADYILPPAALIGIGAILARRSKRTAINPDRRP